MLSNNQIDSNYLYFNDFIQPRLDRRAMQLAGGCRFTADELLAEAADFFVRDFEYLGDAQAVKYGKLCLLRAARSARRHRRGQSLEQLQAGGWEAAADGQDMDYWLGLAGWRDLLDRSIGQLGCQGLRAFWAGIQQGMDRAEATRAAGLTEVQVTRMIDFLSEKVAGRPRQKGRSGGDLDDQQLGLFAAVQGV